MSTTLRSHGFQKATRMLIVKAAEILGELAPMSLRGLHYQMISRGVYANTQANYAKLGRAMTRAREAGQIRWDWIVDNIRQTSKPSSWTGLRDYAETVRECYRKDFWARMRDHVEVFVEKDAMAATLQPATREYDVALHVIRGYISTSYCYSVASQWREIDKPIHAFYLGDWDPSGLDLERSLREKLQLYSGRRCCDEQGITNVDDDDDLFSDAMGLFVPEQRRFNWTRLAIVPDDFTLFDLICLPAKKTDMRAAGFIRRHGNTCAELDAVPPDALRKRLEDAITEHIDVDEWNRLVQVESAERETFSKFMDQLSAK